MSFRARCVLVLHLISIEAKVFQRCELARELQSVHNIPMDQLATWVCIAYHESRYDTAARNPGSGDHGIFQISEHYWCSASGDDILACGLPCSAFEDDDIEDDVVCAKRVYRQHQRLSGNGFNAWSVYRYFCTDPVKVSKYIAGCFAKEDVVSKISNGTRVPKLQFFISFKYTKHYEDSPAITLKPTSTTRNNMYPSFIPVIIPGGCYSCNNSTTDATSHNQSHYHHHQHTHHVHIHHNSTIFRPTSETSSVFNNSLTSTPSQSTHQSSGVITSHRPSSTSTQQPSTTTVSGSSSSTIIVVNPQNPTTVSTNHPSTTSSATSTTAATPLITIPSRPPSVSGSLFPTLQTIVKVNSSHHSGRPQVHQHYNHHLHYHTTKKPFHLKPKNELTGRQFEEIINDSKNEIVLGRSSVDAKQLRSPVSQPLVTYSRVEDNNYQYLLNSNGFKLKFV